MKKLMTLAAFGLGYVLGTRAGRERYEQIRELAHTAPKNLDAPGMKEHLEHTVRGLGLTPAAKGHQKRQHVHRLPRRLSFRPAPAKARSPPATTPAGCAPRQVSPRCAAPAPVDASSGKQRRHRLNRGGDRPANSALWRIVFTRIATDPSTQAYVARRTSEGKTTREIIHWLKGYVAREAYKALTAHARQPNQGPATHTYSMIT